MGQAEAGHGRLHESGCSGPTSRCSSSMPCCPPAAGAQAACSLSPPAGDVQPGSPAGRRRGRGLACRLVGGRRGRHPDCAGHRLQVEPHLLSTGEQRAGLRKGPKLLGLVFEHAMHLLVERAALQWSVKPWGRRAAQPAVKPCGWHRPIRTRSPACHTGQQNLRRGGARSLLPAGACNCHRPPPCTGG